MSNKHSVHIEAPVEKVFGFFTDPKNWQELEPNGVIRDVKVTKEGVGTYFSTVLPIPGVPVEIFDVYTEFVPNRRITEKSSLSFAGTLKWSFERAASGTKLTWQSEPRSFWRLPLLRELAEWGMLKGHEHYMTALKAKLEAKADGKVPPA